MCHILIFANSYKDPELRMTKRVKEYLESKGKHVDVVVSDGNTGEATEEEGMSTECAKDADIMIVLGGDGTVLQAAHEVKKIRIPIAGINLGTVGYLTEIDPEKLETSLDRLTDGDFFVESRMMLLGRVQFADGTRKEGWSLNDVVISRCGSIQMLKLRIYVNGHFLHEYHADGVIMCTPTGSTGYNLSAGGPIVEPTASLITLTPICAHSMVQHSLVLSAEDVIEVEIPMARKDLEQTVEVSFDGKSRIQLRSGDRIRISKSDKTTEFARLGHTSFLETVHSKFGEA